eukprot:16203667-Heterocapsa_arctica.AAC.1
MVLGREERVLELSDNTELVYVIISLGEVGACYGSYGDNGTMFQPTVVGEVREFNIPSHHCTIHVAPSAIAF